jgi:hypothetical protein
MIHRAISLKFVVPTVLILALGISIGAIYLPDKHLVPVDYSVAGSGGITDLPKPDGRLSRVHLLLSVDSRGHGPMTEPAHFDSRPWTQADDDKLRRLAPTGLSSRAIGIRMNRTETAVHSRARQLRVILRKIRLEQLQMG